MYGRIELGWADIEPSDPVIAGSIGDWRLTYHVGALGVDDGGTIKIAMRFASDWGTPQNTDPMALNYFSVSTTGISKLRARFDRKAYYRPWQKAIVIDVLDDALAPGETVTLTLHNSEAQTFCERTFEFRVAVDCFGAGVFLDLPEQLGVRDSQWLARRVGAGDADRGSGRRAVLARGENRGHVGKSLQGFRGPGEYLLGCWPGFAGDGFARTY